LVTEWGSSGHWEVGRTEWGAPLEPTSTEKAQTWAERYRFITGDEGRCLGAYAFYWGSKQETTPTWFGMFLEDESRTELVEVLQQQWAGRSFDTKAPRISALQIDRRDASKSLTVGAGGRARVSFQLQRGRPSDLRIVWELLSEYRGRSVGGDREERPRPTDLEILRESGTRMEFRAPRKPGSYRLFLYVHGEGDTAATANFPFRVE
jgi:hypothetical protein